MNFGLRKLVLNLDFKFEIRKRHKSMTPKCNDIKLHTITYKKMSKAQKKFYI